MIDQIRLLILLLLVIAPAPNSHISASLLTTAKIGLFIDTVLELQGGDEVRSTTSSLLLLLRRWIQWARLRQTLSQTLLEARLQGAVSRRLVHIYHLIEGVDLAWFAHCRGLFLRQTLLLRINFILERGLVSIRFRQLSILSMLV